MAGGGADQTENRLDERALSGAVWADNGGQNAWGHIKVDVPQDRSAVIADREVLNVHSQVRFVPHGRFHSLAQSARAAGHCATSPPSDSVIAVVLCLSMPISVPSCPPSAPMASEYSSPPMDTLCPRLCAASMTASMVRGLMVLSTKIVGTDSSTTRSTV